MTASVEGDPDGRRRVLIAGGGVAGVEALLALHDITHTAAGSENGELLGELERGIVKRVAFAIPYVVRWPLPIRGARERS